MIFLLMWIIVEADKINKPVVTALQMSYDVFSSGCNFGIALIVF